MPQISDHNVVRRAFRRGAARTSRDSSLRRNISAAVERKVSGDKALWQLMCHCYISPLYLLGVVLFFRDSTTTLLSNCEIVVRWRVAVTAGMKVYAVCGCLRPMRIVVEPSPRRCSPPKNALKMRRRKDIAALKLRKSKCNDLVIVPPTSSPYPSRIRRPACCSMSIVQTCRIPIPNSSLIPSPSRSLAIYTAPLARMTYHPSSEGGGDGGSI